MKSALKEILVNRLVIVFGVVTVNWCASGGRGIGSDGFSTFKVREKSAR